MSAHLTKTSYYRRTRSTKGFTLVELLIVIAVIGILAGVLIVIMNPARYLARSRDSRRISDIKTLANSITYAVSGLAIRLTDTTSCADCTSLNGTSAVDGVNGWVKFTVISSGGLSDFIPSLPMDPTNQNQYFYEYGSDGNKFELSTQLEDPQYYIKTTNEGGSDLTKYEVGTNLTIL